MFLLKCIEDNSLCIVYDYKVNCDTATVKIGDVVPFLYGKVQYTGIVIMISNLESDLKAKKKDLIAEAANNMKMIKKNSNKIAKKKDLVKRSQIRKPARYTHSLEEEKKPQKKLSKSKQSKIARNETCTGISQDNVNKIVMESKKLFNIEGSDSSSSFSSVSSNKKKNNEERNKDVNAVKQIRSQIDSHTACSSTPSHSAAKITAETNVETFQEKSQDISNNSDDTEPEETKEETHTMDFSNAYQLYGKNWKEPMIQLNGSGIYCTKRLLNITSVSCVSVTSMARRLMEGVFNPIMIKNCTLTGQSPRAQGKQLQQKKFECLDPMAIKAIVDYAIYFGKHHNWDVASPKDIKRAMTTKLREMNIRPT